MKGHNFGNKPCLKCGKIHTHPRPMLGKIAWNKGLTKDTDPRVLRSCKTHKGFQGFRHTQESKEKIRISNKGQKRSEETKRRIALAKLGDKNPARNSKFIEVYRERGRILQEKYPSNMKGKKLSEETKSKIKLNHWSRKIYQSEEIKKEFFRKMLKSLVKKPNKKEELLNSILQINFPNEWKYVGNGEIWIGTKCPDFINVNGKKLIIELFGDYWHTKKVRSQTDTEEGRRQFFQQYGFSTLVIWDKELKHPETIIKKIKNFIGDSDSSKDVLQKPR